MEGNEESLGAYNITLVPVMIRICHRKLLKVFKLASDKKKMFEKDIIFIALFDFNFREDMLEKYHCHLSTSWLSEITKLGFVYMLESERQLVKKKILAKTNKCSGFQI